MNACLAFCLSELWKIICWQSFCYEDIYNVKLIIKLGLRQNDPVTVEVKALQLDFCDYSSVATYRCNVNSSGSENNSS